MSGLASVFSYGYTVIQETEILSASVSQLTSLSNLYKGRALYWGPITTYSMVTCTVSAVLLMGETAIRSREGRIPEERHRMWNIVMLGTGSIAVISGIASIVSNNIFKCSSHLYKKCAERLAIELRS